MLAVPRVDKLYAQFRSAPTPHHIHHLKLKCDFDQVTLQPGGFEPPKVKWLKVDGRTLTPLNEIRCSSSATNTNESCSITTTTSTSILHANASKLSSSLTVSDSPGRPQYQQQQQLRSGAYACVLDDSRRSTSRVLISEIGASASLPQLDYTLVERTSTRLTLQFGRRGLALLLGREAAEARVVYVLLHADTERAVLRGEFYFSVSSTSASPLLALEGLRPNTNYRFLVYSGEQSSSSSQLWLALNASLHTLVVAADAKHDEYYDEDELDLDEEYGDEEEEDEDVMSVKRGERVTSCDLWRRASLLSSSSASSSSLLFSRRRLLNQALTINYSADNMNKLLASAVDAPSFTRNSGTPLQHGVSQVKLQNYYLYLRVVRSLVTLS